MKNIAALSTGILVSMLSLGSIAAPTSLPLNNDLTSSSTSTPATSAKPIKESHVAAPAPAANPAANVTAPAPAAANSKTPPNAAAQPTSDPLSNPNSVKKQITKTLIVNKNSPEQVDIRVNINGNEQHFRFSEDELTNKPLIDKRLSVLDKDSRAAILSALDEINSGKLPLLKAGDMERLETLQSEMDELAKTMKPSSEQMARLGESISKIVDVSIQQRPLDAEGKKMMFIHQVKDGEVTMHLNSLDEAKLHFDMIKTQIEDTELTDAQKAELRAMLAK